MYSRTNFNSYIPNPLAIIILLILMLVGCQLSSPPPSTPTPPSLAEELILYNWEDDMPESILSAFTAEYGIEVTYLTYETQEEAVEKIQAGELYDVVVMENQLVPLLVNNGLLASIDYSNVPNFKNVAANFQDLAYDPGNRYSVPYNWGTTGLLVDSELGEQPISQWADLWEPRYAGQVGLYLDTPRTIIGIALKSLGYSINSEEPKELEEALARLLELKPAIVSFEEGDAAPYFVNGEVVIAMGYVDDAREAEEEGKAIDYLLPKEGTILWGDNFVIPANSPSKSTAELFLNFLLRPEISGQLVNETYYPIPNENAADFIEPEILNDPLIFPPNEDLQNAEILLPLSPEGEKRHQELWQRFISNE